MRKLIISLITAAAITGAAAPAFAQPPDPAHALSHVVASGSCNGPCHLT